MGHYQRDLALGRHPFGAALGTEPILTVTDEPAGRGRSRGVISFQTIAGKVRFAIDTDHAAAAGLIFRSKLLSLAET